MTNCLNSCCETEWGQGQVTPVYKAVMDPGVEFRLYTPFVGKSLLNSCKMLAKKGK